MFNRTFVTIAADRAVRTFAQTMLGFVVVGQTGILDMEWQGALSVSIMAMIASVLTSIVGLPEAAPSGAPGGGSVTPAGAPPEEGAASEASTATHRWDLSDNEEK